MDHNNVLFSRVSARPPAPAPTACTLMSPQMMARITMNRDSAELGQDSDNGEKTAGVSSFFGESSKEENIFPRVVDVVALVSALHGDLVALVFLEKHWYRRLTKQYMK